MNMEAPKMKTFLTDEEIGRLGLKSGIEIHQQLEGKKLFCDCPTIIRDDKPEFVVKRYLRASAGESGKIDAAAMAETKKHKYYVYEGYEDSTCLVELDEQPPGEVNRQALDAALKIAKLFGMNVVDQLRFMRKTVVNGSNTSGFQRTGLVATGGKLPDHDVGVEVLCLEEDACKEVESDSEKTIYNLSRLGIPLLEIATAPDLKTPEQIAEVSEYIGMVLRSLPNVKRGLGTIRQDVNVSIKEGVRVEIKGAQDLKMIPALVRNEALRQHNLLIIFEELKRRWAKVTDDNGNVRIRTIKSLEKTESKVIRSALDNGGVVYGVKLKGFAGLLGLKIQTGRRYGSELSDYAKVMGVKGLFHSDELPAYGITETEKQAIFQELACTNDDAFILIADKEEVAQRAIAAAIERAGDFSLRKEVRTAKPDGSTMFMRPMPGAARMYPETDVKPVTIDLDSVEVPELLSKKIKDIVEKYGLTEDVAKRLLKDKIDIDNLTNKYNNLKPSFIVDFFYSLPSQLKKKHNTDIDIFKYSDILLEKLNNNTITKDSLDMILFDLAHGKEINYDSYKVLSIDEIRPEVEQVVKEMQGAPRGAIIGKLMGKYKGKVDGKALNDLITSLL